MPRSAITPKKSLKFPSVDIVEASAGSGKTHALAKRYVRLILDPSLKTEDTPLKAVLAVTFTNKATVEMKQRILELLKKTALGTSLEKKPAHEAVDDIISHYNFFQVQTIDSLINTLLKSCSFHLGLASDFRVKENYRSYLTYGLDRLIDKVRGSKKVLGAFEDFLSYYLFVENKDGWFSKRDIMMLIEALYNYGNIYGGAFKIPDVRPEEIIKKKKTVLGLFEKIRENAPAPANKGFVKALDAFLERNKDGFSIEKVSDFFGRDGFPANKHAKIPQKIVKLWSEARKNLKELCLLESFAIFRPYIEIFALTLDEFAELAGIDDVIFLEELNARARGLMGKEGMSVPELYYRAAARFKHYLIDEFQDTSLLQWKNIFPMVEEALSSGGSLFYVGDKKQAIFRFRGGDVSLFDSIRGDLKSFEPERTALSKNWRSQKEIVEFNNAIFSEGNLRRFLEENKHSGADIRKVLDVYSGSRQERKQENRHGYVKIEPFDAPTVEDRDTIMRGKLLPLINGLKKRFPVGDIAVLARQNSDIKLFTSWLIGDGIPVESEKTLNIRENSYIKEIVSFLGFLNSPIDDLAFASFIMGEIFQKASYLSRETVQDFLFRLGAGRKKSRDAYMYRRFTDEFGQAWDDLVKDLFKSAGSVPPYELVISIFSKFRVVENFPGHQAFFMKFLELIKEKEDDYSGLSSFLEFFEGIGEKDLSISVSDTDAVKIMTIHKAKGLEFPVVVIPYLEMDVNAGTGMAGSKKPFAIRQEEDGGLRLMQFKKKYGLFSEELGAQYEREYIKSLIDELNSLYVALTRAEYELYAFVPSKSGNKNNLARALVCPGGPEERGSKREYKSAAEKEKPGITLPASRYSDWLSVLKDEFKGHLELAKRESVMRGSVIHFILSCVGNLQDKDRDEALRAAREKARYAFPYEKRLDEYVKSAANIAENMNFRRFFYVKDGNVFQEKELASASGARKVVDRLVVTKKEAWIVDYKSSKDETGDQVRQVAEYIAIVKALYPGKKVSGFLIYFDTAEMEEVSAKSGSV